MVYLRDFLFADDAAITTQTMARNGEFSPTPFFLPTENARMLQMQQNLA